MLEVYCGILRVTEVNVPCSQTMPSLVEGAGFLITGVEVKIRGRSVVSWWGSRGWATRELGGGGRVIARGWCVIMRGWCVIMRGWCVIARGWCVITDCDNCQQTARKCWSSDPTLFVSRQWMCCSLLIVPNYLLVA